MTHIAPTLTRILITDVLVAHEHLCECDDQSRRRNLVRACFAAIEGEVWQLRGHILDVGSRLGELDPLDMFALRDTGYAVGDTGTLRPTAQYIPLRTAIKYVLRRAQAISPGFVVDYTADGWSKLITAINVRHRITHPKTADDMTITRNDLQSTSGGMNWVLAVTEEAMGAIIGAHRIFNDEMRALLASLKSGDSDALRLYNEVLLRNE